MIAHGAVIRTLWLGKTTGRKTYRTAVIGHEHIFLLKTEPKVILVLIIINQVASIRHVRRAVGIVDLA